jgi:hypothetical protein
MILITQIFIVFLQIMIEKNIIKEFISIYITILYIFKNLKNIEQHICKY